MKNRKGFTIVELVIVIAVIGILAGVLIPTFTTVTKKARLTKATTEAKNASTAVNSAMSGTLTPGSLFAVSNDSDWDAEYWFAYAGAEIAQVDINAGDYPYATTITYDTTDTEKVIAKSYTIYVSTKCFSDDDLTDAQIAANLAAAKNYALSVATKGNYKYGGNTVEIASGVSSTGAKAAWTCTYNEVTYTFEVWDNEDLQTSCIAFIKMN